MSRSYSFCNNCGQSGHAFHQCKRPITSTGVVCYRHTEAGTREYLLIRRKDTLGYVEFLRGKYQLDDLSYIKRLVEEMTLSEKARILSQEFDTLWAKLWGRHVGIQYRGEEKESREKFASLREGITLEGTRMTIADIVSQSTTSYEEPEWGLPKGRRNYQERDLSAALREFQEETGYKVKDLAVVVNLSPLEECFTGSNLKSYKHSYFLAYQHRPSTPSPFQQSEVSAVKWMSCAEALSRIRPYNIEKREVLDRAHQMLNTYRIYY